MMDSSISLLMEGRTINSVMDLDPLQVLLFVMNIQNEQVGFGYTVDLQLFAIHLRIC